MGSRIEEIDNEIMKLELERAELNKKNYEETLNVWKGKAFDFYENNIRTWIHVLNVGEGIDYIQLKEFDDKTVRIESWRNAAYWSIGSILDCCDVTEIPVDDFKRKVNYEVERLWKNK